MVRHHQRDTFNPMHRRELLRGRVGQAGRGSEVEGRSLEVSARAAIWRPEQSRRRQDEARSSLREAPSLSRAPIDGKTQMVQSTQEEQYWSNTQLERGVGW